MYHHYLMRLKQDDYDSLGEEPEDKQKKSDLQQQESQGAKLLLDASYYVRQTRKNCVEAITPMFDDSESSSFITRAIEHA